MLGDVAGAPNKLPYAEDVYKYMRMLEKASPRVKVFSIGTTEEGFLQPLNELVERGYTRAEELLRKWREEWNGDLSRLFTEYNFL